MIDVFDERYEGMITADGLDTEIIGTAQLFNAEVFVYDVQKVLDILMTRDEMSYEDAWEFFSFNIEGTYVGEGTPIWMHSLPDVEEVAG